MRDHASHVGGAQPRRGGARGRARRVVGGGMGPRGTRTGATRGGKNKGRGRRRGRGRGELTSGNKSGDLRLQNLGHHGGERGGRERELCAGELNEGKETRGGGAWHGEGQGARGAWAKARPSWAGSGRTGLG
jgi:hypothetical protein